MPWRSEYDSGSESWINVWEPDAAPTPVPASTDPELPAAPSPAPLPTNTSTTTSNNAATTGSGYSTPSTSSPAYGSAEYWAQWNAAREGSRETVVDIANQYGQDSAVTYTVDGRTYLGVGKTEVDITDQYAALAQSRNIPQYPTTPPFAGIAVSAVQQNITQPTSEVEKFLQWQASQNDTYGTETIAEKWAKQGISNPYSDPFLIAQAQEQIDRANARTALGVTGQVAPWNDPNWPSLLGTNKEAYDTATLALKDVNARNQLMAENGWDQATFDSWALRSTNPTAWGEQAAAYDAANGIVAGPGGAVTSLSSNAATVVTTAGLNAAGFPNIATAKTAVNTALGAANGAITGATNLVNNAVGSVSNLLTNPPALDPSKVFSGLTGTAAAAAGLSTATNLITNIIKNPPQLPTSASPFVQAATDALGIPNLSAVENLFGNQASTLALAKKQATFQARYNTTGNTDWRVRLQLAPGADYLYKDGNPGILAPLFDTDGVIFPYTPSIETSYSASYDKYDLTHSNYRGYFYKGSAVNDINIRGTFTAQDTQEANYVLAVIHFFRSVTKMFYGQDAIRGAPPPLVYLSGLGNFQFNQHPCLVANFSYSLPSEVDYIRALAPNNYGNLFSQRDRTGSTSGGLLGPTATRLLNSLLDPSNPSQPNVPSPSYINGVAAGANQATYVPTKIEINLTLLPTNTRSQVSQQFSVKEFANGNLIKGGFW